MQWKNSPSQNLSPSSSIDRVLVIVLDGVGVGELPDAGEYGDQGSNTLGNLARAVGGLNLPNLRLMGLGNIIQIEGVAPQQSPRANFGKLRERAPGKDSTSGHWELMGLTLKKPFPTYPHGFPPELIAQFEARIGRKILGNYPASGTQIIQELGEEHQRSGRPIIYTSADSVFQVAAHEEVIPPEELYRICLQARELLTGENGVGRVIARPFLGQPGSYFRTERRRDFSLPPPGDTVLDLVKANGYPVVGIGKIPDLFAGKGLSEQVKAKSNRENMTQILRTLRRAERGLIFTNLVDFDMLWGHRNNPQGFAQGLKELDDWLPDLWEALRPSDLLLITADHGCDPTTPGTDHSREWVPLLAWGKGIRSGVNLGERESFADLGATVAQALGIRGTGEGRSFLGEIT